jgi:hypothetical protein
LLCVSTDKCSTSSITRFSTLPITTLPSIHRSATRRTRQQPFSVAFHPAIEFRHPRAFCLSVTAAPFSTPSEARDSRNWRCTSASSGSISFGANLGALNYTVTTTARSCVSAYGPVNYTVYTYNNFDYVSSNMSQPISGSTYFDYGIGGRYVGSGNCPQYPLGPSLTYSGSGYTITINPPHIPLYSNPFNASIVVPGYINPKYVVLGVTYAPPGPQSFVNYASSSLVSNTSSASNIFASGYTYSVTLTTSVGISGYLNGSAKSTASQSFTQQSTTSSSITVEKTTGVSLQVPGPANAYVGVDHDYDVIWVWLNPVALFTLSNGGKVVWTGYGYSVLDQNAMDVIGVYAGCLNGNLLQSSCNNLYQTPFARTWAASELWPSGQGPGLTTTDLQNILAPDPCGSCSSTSGIGSSACPSSDVTRFTLSLNQNIQYQQPPPGGQPFTVGYTESYANTSTHGTGAKYTSSQTFGYEATFSGHIFKTGFDLSISKEQTLSWENEWNKQFTSGTMSTAQASITGPTCNVVNSACSPAYPPSSPTYGQAIGFDVYQDNLFGTFLFVLTSY